MKKLLELLIEYGGSIVSSNALSSDWVNQARVSGRMWVDEFGYGFIWEPPLSGFPTTDKEVEMFEKWYPLTIEMPEHLKNADLLFDRLEKRKKEQITEREIYETLKIKYGKKDNINPFNLGDVAMRHRKNKAK